MNNEERIREYVRSRADVLVPADLQWPSTAPTPRRRWVLPPLTAWARVAVAGVAVAVLAVGVLWRAPSTTGPAVSQSPGPDGSSLPSGQPFTGDFPATMAGLPVVTVAHAVELLQAGRLDGAAVAVAGYFDAMMPSCPMPGRYIGPLESWCDIEVLADTRAGAKLCHPYGDNGTECSVPKGVYLRPFFTSETSGNPWSLVTGGATGEPAALVLIGHAGDARQWRCSAANQTECANAFVVDQVAWANGQDVPLAAPQTGSQQSGEPVAPKMTLAEVSAAAGLSDNLLTLELLTGAPFLASDIATIDPRWNLAGDNVMWLVRSLAPGQGETGDENVWLVDDATRKLVDSHPLKLDPSYQPARLWPMATVHGYNCCGGNLEAFMTVQGAGGDLVYEGLVSGSISGNEDITTFGGGYGSGVLVLPAGSYTITAWLADYAGQVMSRPTRQCSMPITLRPLDDVALNADFPADQACTFGPSPSTWPRP